MNGQSLCEEAEFVQSNRSDRERNPEDGQRKWCRTGHSPRGVVTPRAGLVTHPEDCS